MTTKKITKEVNYRTIFLLIWTICYCLILLFCILTIEPDNTISFKEDIGPIMSKLSSILLPQMALIYAFFFSNKKAEEINKIIRTTPHSKLALGLALSYILIFLLLVFLGIYCKVLPGEPQGKITLSEANNMIVEIMGYFSVLSTLPMAYLFTKR